MRMVQPAPHALPPHTWGALSGRAFGSTRARTLARAPRVQSQLISLLTPSARRDREYGRTEARVDQMDRTHSARPLSPAVGCGGSARLVTGLMHWTCRLLVGLDSHSVEVRTLRSTPRPAELTLAELTLPQEAA